MPRAEYWRRMAASEHPEATFLALAIELAGKVAAGADKRDAVDMLQELAQAHGLVRKLGNDRITEIMARAFGWNG